VAWPPGANGVRLTNDLEDVVRECLELPAVMKNLWNTTFDRIASRQYEQAEEIAALRDPLENLFDETIAGVEAVRARVQERQGSGAPINRADELGAALKELRRIKDFVFEHWPRFDDKDDEEAWAAYRRGESIPLDDLIHELQNRNK
jgi:hypothetical protein